MKSNLPTILRQGLERTKYSIAVEINLIFKVKLLLPGVIKLLGTRV